MCHAGATIAVITWVLLTSCTFAVGGAGSLELVEAIVDGVTAANRALSKLQR